MGCGLNSGSLPRTVFFSSHEEERGRSEHCETEKYGCEGDQKSSGTEKKYGEREGEEGSFALTPYPIPLLFFLLATIYAIPTI